MGDCRSSHEEEEIKMPNHGNSTPRRTLTSTLVLAVTVMTYGLVPTVPTMAQAEETARFPPEPWGFGTPAERCVVCHSLEQGGPFRVAPNLWGIFNAEKARDRSWYAYSPALLKKGGLWTEQDLDAYLADADAYLPGTSKTISVPSPAERQEIIGFLATLHN
jgi:cytochrome c